MERKFLEGFGLGKAEVDRVMAAHGMALERQKRKAAEAAEACAALEKRLADAEGALEALNATDVDSLRAAAESWEARYNDETAGLRAQLERERCAGQASLLASSEHFSSQAAKEAFVNGLTELRLSEGEGASYDAYRAAFAESDPGAFAPGGAVPRIVLPSAPAQKQTSWREKARRNYSQAREQG